MLYGPIVTWISEDISLSEPRFHFWAQLIIPHEVFFEEKVFLQTCPVDGSPVEGGIIHYDVTGLLPLVNIPEYDIMGYSKM